MVEQHQANSLPQAGDTKRTQRANRILDVAATLILRWGYAKTTIDDVARQAGVAKGTIYLHWQTREALFAALMQRERLALVEDVQQRIISDPSGASLHGIFKHSALALMSRPLIKAVLLRDSEVVGKLAHSEQSQALLTERVAGFHTYLLTLRKHGLVRTDIDLQSQVYLVSAIFLGFFLIEPFMPVELIPTVEQRAELMADAIQRALAAPERQDADTAQIASAALNAYVQHDLTLAQQYAQHSIEGEAGA